MQKNNHSKGVSLSIDDINARLKMIKPTFFHRQVFPAWIAKSAILGYNLIIKLYGFDLWN